jgi:hypothetical protein
MCVFLTGTASVEGPAGVRSLDAGGVHPRVGGEEVVVTLDAPRGTWMFGLVGRTNDLLTRTMTNRPALTCDYHLASS